MLYKLKKNCVLKVDIRLCFCHEPFPSHLGFGRTRFSLKVAERLVVACWRYHGEQKSFEIGLRLQKSAKLLKFQQV